MIKRTCKQWVSQKLLALGALVVLQPVPIEGTLVPAYYLLAMVIEGVAGIVPHTV
jgi:hypothetical protein